MTPIEYMKSRETFANRFGRWTRLVAGGPSAILQGLTAMVAMLRAS